MDGKRIGLTACAAINEVIAQMEAQCGNNPTATALAAEVVLRHLSMSKTDAPVTQVLRAIRRQAVLTLHEQGNSEKEIARTLGISRARVLQLRTSTVESETRRR